MISSDHRNDAAPASVEDTRAAPRFSLLLRSAKLICASGEYLCIVRDVSQTGVRLRLFHPLPAAETFFLEAPNGTHLAIEQVWHRDTESGFRFREPIDVDGFISDRSPYPRRAVRLKMDHAATVTFNGNVHDVHLRDLSHQGARIDSVLRLAIGQRVHFKAPPLAGVDATVCWRRHPAHGLVFQQTMSLGELALNAVRLNQSA